LCRQHWQDQLDTAGSSAGTVDGAVALFYPISPRLIAFHWNLTKRRGRLGLAHRIILSVGSFFLLRCDGRHGYQPWSAAAHLQEPTECDN
jgi:hypothetical protein